MQLKNLVQEKTTLLINQAKTIVKNNPVSLTDAWKILDNNISDVVIVLQYFAYDLSKPEKKAKAMEIMSNFYDSVFTVVDFPFIPKILQPVMQKYVKLILMALVDAAIDSSVRDMHRKLNPELMIVQSGVN